MTGALLGPTTDRSEHRLLVLVALAAIWAVVLADEAWIWGVVMIALALRDVVNAQTQFVTQISRHRSPTLFWLVVGSWLTMGALWLLQF